MNVIHILIIIIDERGTQTIGERIEIPCTFKSRLCTHIKSDELILSRIIQTRPTSTLLRGTWRSLPVSVKEFKQTNSTDHSNSKSNSKSNPKIKSKSKSISKPNPLHEIHILERFTSPYIVRALGVATAPTWLGIIYESTQYGMLDSVIVRFALSRPLKLRIALEVARGLAFLHSQGVVHCGLRTSAVACLSLQLSSPVLCRVAGLGAAHNLRGGRRGFNCAAHLRRHGRDVCPRYLAPEVLGAQASCGPEVDVYSFACVFFELWNEELAFAEFDDVSRRGCDSNNDDDDDVDDNDDDNCIFSGIGSGALGRLVESVVVNGVRPSLGTSCPAEVRNVVERCWDSEPKKRPKWKEIIKVIGDALRTEMEEEEGLVGQSSPRVFVDIRDGKGGNGNGNGNGMSNRERHRGKSRSRGRSKGKGGNGDEDGNDGKEGVKGGDNGDSLCAGQLMLRPCALDTELTLSPGPSDDLQTPLPSPIYSFSPAQTK